MAAIATRNSIHLWKGQEPVEYLGLRLDHHEFAVHIKRVREIMRFQSLIAVPGMPSYAKGVITVHGVVVPVVDLRVRLGYPERGPTHRTCIVVVRVESSEVGGGRLIGLLVDGVSDIFLLRPVDIDASSNVARSRIAGKCRRKGRATSLLDVDALLPAS